MSPDDSQAQTSKESEARRKSYDKIKKWLKNRRQWEGKLTKWHNQRYCLDRSAQRNKPWRRASNVRYPLSDTIIDQKKPLLHGVIYAQEQIANFKALKPENVPFASKVAAYFDFVIREQTEFEDEIQYALDRIYEMGECYFKTTYDTKLELPVITEIKPIFIITPDNTNKLKDAEEIIHVLQFGKREFKNLYSQYFEGADQDTLDQFIKDREAIDSDESKLDNDDSQVEDQEYTREGITRSGQGKNIVIWERHYQDKDGKKRIQSLSPDDPEFDLKDDRQYPYDHGEWMFDQHRREFVEKKLHSSRGIPEKLQEYEHAATAAWRAKQDAMTLHNASVYSAPNGIPGNTQNYTVEPGTVVPFALQLQQQPPPPFSWDEEINNIRSIAERLVGTSMLGLGGDEGKKTATEVQRLSNLTAVATDLESSNWKRCIRSVLKKTWSNMVQYKPKKMMFFFKDDLMTLDPDALNDEYHLSLSGSAENINKEWMMDKAQNLFKAAINNPYANMLEIWKNLIQVGFPGQEQRFVTDPKANQAKEAKKAASDIGLMMLGFPVQPEPLDDSSICAMTAMQFLQSKAQTNQPLTPQQVQLITAYLCAHRDLLKKQNPQAFDQLNQALNQMDMQTRQQAAAAHGQRPQMPPQGGQPQSAPQAPSQPMPQRMPSNPHAAGPAAPAQRNGQVLTA